MSEAYLIRNCAPTLAGIKSGSMFSLPCQDPEKLKLSLRKMNSWLVPRGLRLIPLRVSARRALLYLYRPARLRDDLSLDLSGQLLAQGGFYAGSCERCLRLLIQRIQLQDGFPHEFGLFLGYPPEDVLGYIHNNACNCKCSGCWKVYGDVDEAQRRFHLYKKCTRVYCDLWSRGRTIEKLTVPE